MISLFKMAPKLSAEGLSSFPKCKKTILYFTEKMHVLDKLYSGMTYSGTGYEFNIYESTIYIK